MSNGVLTAAVAHSLKTEFYEKGFDVFHDHAQDGNESPEGLGKIRSWFGSALKSESLLANIDLAIVSRQNGKIYALIEIEETNNKPKVILGDILATLLGSGIAYQGNQDLEVGDWTTFLVMVKDVHKLHHDRLTFLCAQTNLLKKHLNTPNAEIGRIIIDTFSTSDQLEEKLRNYVNEAINYRTQF
jgi:hypothetical protein